MPDLREYISSVSQDTTSITRHVSTVHEVAAITAQADGSGAVLFENVGDGGFRLVSNLVGSRSRFAVAVGADERNIHERMISCINGARPPQTVKQAKFMENTTDDASILPIVYHFEKEPGPFITSSIIHAQNPESGRQNSSFHRMMPISKNRFSVRMVEGRHLHRCFVDAQEHGEDLSVAITVGVHPAISIAGAYQAEWGHDEMHIANSILNGDLTLARSPHSKMLVPSEAEIVMEGRFLQDVTHAEWMVEMLQTYDHKRDQPVFELEALHFRDDPIFHDILPGYLEHRLLMGMPIESKINHEMKLAFPKTRQVTMTRGGCGWLHAVVQAEKTTDTEPRDMIMAAFKSHRSLKQVTIVDTDIDPNSAESVEYAMATRFQADQDLIIIRNVRGSSLDPSSDQENLRTAKMGIDATRSLSKNPEGFEIAKIPGYDQDDTSQPTA